MKVNVTRKHIDEASLFGVRRCPVALALKELGWNNVLVGTHEIFLEGLMYEMSKPLFDFVEAFDTYGKAVSPFSFEFTPLDFQI